MFITQFFAKLSGRKRKLFMNDQNFHGHNVNVGGRGGAYKKYTSAKQRELKAS